MSEVKKCKHCKSEIDKKAKICPSCKKRQGIPIWIVIVIAVLIIGFIGSQSEKEKKPADTSNVSEATKEATSDVNPTVVPTIQPTVKPVEEKSEDPTKTDGYEGGMYKIGSDMPKGEYLIIAEESILPSYLELAKNSDGDLDSIITNDVYTNRVYITVKDGQYLKFDGFAIKAKDAEPYNPTDGIYTDGMYLVGKDIPAGEYKVKLSEGTSMGMGYLEVAKDSSQTLDSIITNNVIESDTYQTIKDGQYITLNGAEISTK